jgi:nitroreductase
VSAEIQLDTLLSRVSVKALGDPGPDDATLRLIFEAAVRAPDHGRLRPWRFFVVRGGARERLSELFAIAARRRDASISEAQLEKERGKPRRAPVTIVVVAKIVPSQKIPEIEQVLSTAGAAMNILNAVHALGFGAQWVTGENCYDPEFRAAMGLDETHRLIGFIHVGTPLGNLPPMDRPNPDEFVIDWPQKSSGR